MPTVASLKIDGAYVPMPPVKVKIDGTYVTADTVKVKGDNAYTPLIPITPITVSGFSNGFSNGFGA